MDETMISEEWLRSKEFVDFPDRTNLPWSGKFPAASYDKIELSLARKCNHVSVHVEMDSGGMWHVAFAWGKDGCHFTACNMSPPPPKTWFCSLVFGISFKRIGDREDVKSILSSNNINPPMLERVLGDAVEQYINKVGHVKYADRDPAEELYFKNAQELRRMLANSPLVRYAFES